MGEKKTCMRRTRQTEDGKSKEETKECREKKLVEDGEIKGLYMGRSES